MAERADPGWIELAFEADADAAERLGEHLERAGALAVTLVDAADAPLYEPDPGTTPLWRSVRVSALFAPDVDTDALAGRLAADVAPQPLPEARVRFVADRDWARAAREDVEPIRCGRLWVGPSWERPPDDAEAVVLDPGLAFGTGRHPTTRLCLAWIERTAIAGAGLVDYGCGSGILALAAARLGAAPVRAVDVDPQALAATRDNAARNRLDAAIEALAPEALPETPVPVLVANILAEPLARLAPRFARLVAPGGRIALAGLLEAQAPALENAYRPWFRLAVAGREEGWALLAGRRRRDEG